MMYEDFGEKLLKIRKAKGLTQTELGEIIGRGYSSISKYENGSQKPELDTVVELADILNVSIDYLVGKKEPSTISVDGLHDEQIVLLETLTEQFRKNNCTTKKMTEEQCALIGRIVEEFIK